MAPPEVEPSLQGGRRSLYQVFKESLFIRRRTDGAVEVTTDKLETEKITLPEGTASLVKESQEQSEVLKRTATNLDSALQEEAKDSKITMKSKPGNDLDEQVKSPKTFNASAGKASEDPSGRPKLAKNKDKKKEIVSSSFVVPRLEVCLGKKCKVKGSEDLLTQFQTASSGKVEIAYTKCMKECKIGMNVRVTKDGSTFEFNHKVSVADVQPILCQHFDW